MQAVVGIVDPREGIVERVPGLALAAINQTAPQPHQVGIRVIDAVVTEEDGQEAHLINVARGGCVTEIGAGQMEQAHRLPDGFLQDALGGHDLAVGIPVQVAVRQAVIADTPALLHQLAQLRATQVAIDAVVGAGWHPAHLAQLTRNHHQVAGDGVLAVDGHGMCQQILETFVIGDAVGERAPTFPAADFDVHAASCTTRSR